VIGINIASVIFGDYRGLDCGLEISLRIFYLVKSPRFNGGSDNQRRSLVASLVRSATI